MPTDKPRYTITVDAELDRRIKDFWHDNHYPNRSAATVALVQMGLKYLENNHHIIPADITPRTKPMTIAAHNRTDVITDKKEKTRDIDMIRKEQF